MECFGGFNFQVRKEPKRGVNSFNDSWLTEGRFKNWLVKVSSTTAKCRQCGTTLDIRNMGVSRFSDRAKYKKHKGKEHDINPFLANVLNLYSRKHQKTKGINKNLH